MLKWPLGAEFDPDDTKDYVANWTSEMTARDDTIVSALFVTDTATNGLEIMSSTVDDTAKKAIVWLRAADKPKLIALAGTTVPIDHTINTSAGRTINRTLGLKIKQR